MNRTEEQYAGYACLKLENAALALWVTTQVGPRVIGLGLQGGLDLFAKLPHATASWPQVGTYRFRGGHRFWLAPEDPRRTYRPDDDPVTVADVPRGVRVTQPVQAPLGVQKSLEITVPDRRARVVVDHVVTNVGAEAIELAPWAITQLRPGGLAILPQATGPADAHGLLPNRQIALWPYTSVDSPHVTWGDRYVFVEATMRSGALKIGFPNPAGWLAYAVDDALFVKHAPFEPDATYVDRGSSSECYCHPQFLELETLGPRTALSPGASVRHRERWTVYEGVSVEPVEDAVQQLVEVLRWQAMR